MFNADLYVPARWRLRAVSIGAGALILAGGPTVIGWAPAAMAAPVGAPKPPPPPPAPKPAPAPKDDTKTPPPPAPKDDAKPAPAANDDTKTPPPPKDPKPAPAPKDDSKPAPAPKDDTKTPPPPKDPKPAPAPKPTKAPKPGNDQGSAGGSGDTTGNDGGNASNPGQDGGLPPGQTGDLPGNGNDGGVVVPPGQSGDLPGNNGDNGNHGQANSGDNGNHGVGNNGSNGNHGQGNNGGNGNHGVGNNGNGGGHQSHPVSVVFTGPAVGPDSWAPFGPATSDSASALSTLLFGPAAALATSGSMSGPGLLDGQTHVLGEKFEASSPTAQLSASQMLKAFDKQSKARTPRMKAQPNDFTGTALTSGSWHNTGSAIPLLALLLLAEVLVLARRFGNKLRPARPAAAMAATGNTPTQVRWA